MSPAPCLPFQESPRIAVGSQKDYFKSPILKNTGFSSNSGLSLIDSAFFYRLKAFQFFRVDDPVSTGGAAVGDRCVWVSESGNHKGTIKFIGHLKGHSSLYAGVDFDEMVGKGTGVFQGEVLFQTPENHAGFVLLSALEIIPQSVVTVADGQNRHLPLIQKQLSFGPLGSCVEVCHLGACRMGVIRWIGDAMSDDRDHIERSAVVELDETSPSGWRPAYEAPMSSAADIMNGVLVPTSALRRDRRIDHSAAYSGAGSSGVQTFLKFVEPAQCLLPGRSDFGSIDSGVEPTKCEPWKITEDLVGRMKGIQGHKNSCYLDATLYAMFVQSTAFDRLLERPATRDDIPQYRELQRLLASEVVYPLRKFHYVRADHIMKVRELLAKCLPHMRGLTSEEKDPEEVLTALFGELLRAPPLVELMLVFHYLFTYRVVTILHVVRWCYLLTIWGEGHLTRAPIRVVWRYRGGRQSPRIGQFWALLVYRCAQIN
ncbi:unnamed protein product [Haemonchus placei]|uniref:ubiquitinyl hydrolase 1 n=1 Tax=Haemonchus placei TaxID=6290 RepID=A0A0N4X5L3_HAEPC|nr:unnamed protein product [Haemonchus placei]